ncbi:MAG: hypothetical protein WA815_03465 [Terracidiphilus sp.]
MNMRYACLALVTSCALLAAIALSHEKPVQAASRRDAKDEFHDSTRCVACHNGLKTPSGEDISIGFQWSASIMANSARDPYWQGSVRRESIDHPDVTTAIQDECSTCHMPAQHLIDKAEGRETEVFARLPLTKDHDKNKFAEDGVTCSVCHQVEKTGLGTKQTFNGNVDVASAANRHDRPEYGPFLVDAGHQTVMRSSTNGFVPQQAAHIRDAGLCGSCHTLYTVARGPGGKPIGQLPEQMPFQEWEHSDYRTRQTCQECHMPAVAEAVPVTALYGPKRDGMHRHVFVGGNFLMEQMLNDHRKDLDVSAQAQELETATNRTQEFLRTQSARLSLLQIEKTADGIAFRVKVENLTGHKLPTAYPSRRIWLHVTVRDNAGKLVFESGALNPDGSITGNDNDADPLRFEPHYIEITGPEQVEIFEPILGDSQGHVTTGLLSAVGYLKDNRILPTGFDKQTADHDIAVVCAAHDDPNFTGGSASVRYAVKSAQGGPYKIRAELWYQPVGFRWAHNLAPYQAAEPQRFVSYYEQASHKSAIVLAEATGTF